MQNFFKGVFITIIAEAISSFLDETTKFLVSAYRRQLFLFFRGVIFVMMGVLGISFLAFLLVRPPMPVVIIFVIIAYVIFKWLQKANQLLSLELKRMNGYEYE